MLICILNYLIIKIINNISIIQQIYYVMQLFSFLKKVFCFLVFLLFLLLSAITIYLLMNNVNIALSTHQIWLDYHPYSFDLLQSIFQNYSLDSWSDTLLMPMLLLPAYIFLPMAILLSLIIFCLLFFIHPKHKVHY